ncbi:MAG: dephospho-CoA kinase [Propionibacteriaceae bacterium]|nr:dephospho-CoA kinase [Propionibacteriaceae bacterium]
MKVALTGGIACGKSTASDWLRRRGVCVIDYDQLAHDVVAPGTAGETAVIEAFGPDIAVDGQLSRQALGQRVFTSSDARLKLEAIVHPLVYQAADAAQRDAEQCGHHLVVHEIPLLVEVMDPSAFDQVVVVDAPAPLRVRRLVEGRGMAPEEASRRLAAQTSDQHRLAVADVVWDGSGSPDDLRAQVDCWLSAVGQDIPSS